MYMYMSDASLISQWEIDLLRQVNDEAFFGGEQITLILCESYKELVLKEKLSILDRLVKQSLIGEYSKPVLKEYAALSELPSQKPVPPSQLELDADPAMELVYMAELDAYEFMLNSQPFESPEPQVITTINRKSINLPKLRRLLKSKKIPNRPINVSLVDKYTMSSRNIGCLTLQGVSGYIPFKKSPAAIISFLYEEKKLGNNNFYTYINFNDCTGKSLNNGDFKDAIKNINNRVKEFAVGKVESVIEILQGNTTRPNAYRWKVRR